MSFRKITFALLFFGLFACGDPAVEVRDEKPGKGPKAPAVEVVVPRPAPVVVAPAQAEAVRLVRNEPSPSVWPAGAARYLDFEGPAGAKVRVSARGGLFLATPAQFSPNGLLKIYVGVSGDAPKRLAAGGVKGEILLEVAGHGDFRFPVEFNSPR